MKHVTQRIWRKTRTHSASVCTQTTVPEIHSSSAADTSQQTHTEILNHIQEAADIPASVWMLLYNLDLKGAGR